MTYAPKVPAVIYEVVPDRFRIGRGLSQKQKLQDRAYCRPGVRTELGPHRSAEVHHGGDLRGLVEAIPHLKRLSVTGLYLNPIFPSVRADKLGSSDFLEVDPAFGTMDDFHDLVDVAREAGIGIILGGAFNYVGEDHPWFQNARAQADEDGWLDPSQRTRSFFFFQAPPGQGHATFHGEPGHPELNLQNHDLRRRLFAGERSVVHEWLERGAAGWCLHRADELGYSVLREITLSTRTGGEQKFVCVDGPEFNAHEVDFALLADRLSPYRDFEKAALEKRHCQLGPQIAEVNAAAGAAPAGTAR